MTRSATAPAIKTSLSSFEQAALAKVMDAPAPAPQSQEEIMRNIAAYAARSAAKRRR